MAKILRAAGISAQWHDVSIGLVLSLYAYSSRRDLIVAEGGSRVKRLVRWLRLLLTMLAEMILARRIIFTVADALAFMRRKGPKSVLVAIVGAIMRRARQLPVIRGVAAKEMNQNLENIRKHVLEGAPDCGKFTCHFPRKALLARLFWSRCDGRERHRRIMMLIRAWAGSIIPKVASLRWSRMRQ